MNEYSPSENTKAKLTDIVGCVSLDRCNDHMFDEVECNAALHTKTVLFL